MTPDDIDRARRNTVFGKSRKAVYRGYVIQRRRQEFKQDQFTYWILGQVAGEPYTPPTAFDDLDAVFEEIDYLVEKQPCSGS